MNENKGNKISIAKISIAFDDLGLVLTISTRIKMKLIDHK